MTESEAKKSFEWLLEYCLFLKIEEIQIIWHGGEPLLLGEKFYASICVFIGELFNKNEIHVTHSMQTNLILFTADYFDIFKTYFNSTIGFSVDYRSKFRLFSDGQDASSEIINKAQWAQNNGFRLGAISMVNHQNVDDPAGMYNFFKSLGIPFRANRIFPTSINTFYNDISSQQYGNFLCALFDIMLSDSDPLIIRTISEYIDSFLYNNSDLCCLSNSCQNSFISISPRGELLPCGRYDPSGEYVLGTVFDSTPQEVFDRKNELYFPEKTSLDKDTVNCPECKFNLMCHSGCPYSKSSGWFIEECKVNKIIWGHISDFFMSMNITPGLLESKNGNGEIV